MKKIRRVTSLVVAAAFLFNESAMAFVNVAEPHKDKLSPKTIFTSSDKTDQFVRVAAKYIETQLGSAISKMPLAGVERSLSDIREIASSLSIDGRTFRVSGGSGEGQVIIELSDSHIIRYFNPQMTGLSLGRTDISVLGEYDVNKYLRFQFIRFSKDIPFGEREPSSGSPDIFLQVKGRAPEGSLLEAYKVLVEDFSKKVFTRQEFRLKRVKSSGRVFSATTVNTELDAFVYLGILVPDTSKKPFTYVIADRYGRASSKVVEGVKTVLSGAAFASPSKDDLNRLLPHLEDALNGEVDAIVPEDLVFRASYLFDPLTDEDVRALFARAEEDISILDIKLRSGYTLAVPAREIFINAFDSIKEKAEAKVEGGKLYGEISITVEKVMDGLAITILDNGPGIITPSELGIPPASLTGYAQYGSKVTDIPVSTKIGGGGSGLSLVRSMLVSSGGHISWRKRSGGGTRVKLIVPVSSIMDEDLQRLGLGERRKVGSRGVNLEAGKVQIFADKYPVEVTVEEIYREYVRRVEKGIIGPDVRGTYASIPVLADSPEKWPEHFKAGWEADFIKELSGLDSDALAEKFLARHKGNAQKNLRFMRTVSDDPPNLMDIWGNVASYVEHPDYMSLFSEQAKREITEQYWMVVEWFYRHWDRAPKERSWDIIVRSDVLGNKDGNAEKILPPKGSIYGVYKYMVDGGIIRDQGYMFDKEIAAGLGRSVYTIEPDLRALSGHLNLIEKVGGSDEGYAYSLTGKAAAMSEKILPLLERFRADDLRPSGVDLDRFYEEEIAPILDPDEEDVRIVASLASFGHGTNEVTEVTTLVGPVMGMTDILRETMKGDPSIREKMKDVLENVTLLHSSLNTFFDLYSKASMAVRGNTLNKIDAKRWRNDAVEALRNVKSSFKALAQGRVLNREDIPEKDMFRVIMEQLKGDAIQALEDRVRLMKGELSGDVVDLNDLLNKFDDTIRIKEGKMLRKSFRLTRSDAPVLVRGNEISLLSMICNIASNGACYAYAARGDDAKVDIRLSVDGGEAVLTISDNGPGMAEEGIAKLEKPFYTTGGTGIGMTESRSTARMHGGKILIKSKEGEGSTFEIRLPLARGVTGDEFESDGFKDNKESSIERRIEDLKERMDEFSPAEQMKLAVHFNEIYAEFIENPLSSWARGKGMGYDELFDLARAPVRWLRIIENERELDFIEKISRVPAAELEDMFAERFPLASRVFQGGVNLRNMKRFAYEGRGADAAENLEDIYSMLKFLLDAGMPDRVRQMKLREALFVLLEWMYRHWDNDPKDNSYRSMISGAEDLSLSRVFSERLVSPGGMTAGKREAIRGVIDPVPISITLEKAGAVLPELVNSLITAAYKNEKLVLAIDDDIASGWTREELDHVITALSRLSSRDDQLGSFLRNMVIRRGRGAELAKNLSSMVEKGGVRKEGIMVLAKSSNIPFFKEFEDASTITAIDDRIMTEELYYPLLEITLFTVARAVGYSKEKLVECYRGIPNIDMLDESVICGLCWDDAAGRPRATVLIRLIPGAARAEDKGLYRALAEYIAAAA